MDPDSLKIIAQIDEMYNNALSNILLLVGAFITISCILIPIILQIWQNRFYKLREEGIENDLLSKLAGYFEEFKKDSVSEIKYEFNKEYDKIKKELILLDYKSHGCLLMLQGAAFAKEEKYLEAASNYIAAAKILSKTDSEQNLQSSLGAITIVIDKFKVLEYPTGNFDDFELEKMPKSIKELIDAMNKINENERYSTSIIDLEKALKKILDLKKST